jgi:hypothetical protein
MSAKTKYNMGQYYFGILGLFIIGFGILELLFFFTGGQFSYGILQIPPAIVRSVVIGCMGIFMLAGALKLKSIDGLALVTLACIMIWIFAANDIFEVATASILPAEEEEADEETVEEVEGLQEAEEEGTAWFNSWEGFLETWKGPYNPCVILLPFTLPILQYIRNYKEDLRVFGYL